MWLTFLEIAKKLEVKDIVGYARELMIENGYDVEFSYRLNNNQWINGIE